MTISEFLRVLDSSKGVQGNKMLFVENCYSSTKYVIS
jgi:cystathionine beta-lyase family protein involved in aluminum resistance